MSDPDFLIVGAGAAGAACAWRLTKHGFTVVCLENGSWVDASQYPTTGADWEIRKKRDFSPIPSVRKSVSDYPIDDSQSPISICNFNAVGGSTILYSGHFPRFLPRDFKLHTNDGVGEDWPIDYQRLKPYFEINEHQMGASGLTGDPFYPDIEKLLPPVPIGETGERLGIAFNSLGWHWWPSYSAISTRSSGERATCLNLGPCNTGCPQGAKGSADITYVRRACNKGLTLITEASVSRVLEDSGKAIGVEYFDQAGVKHVQYAKNVILAASAIGTPRILLNSASTRFPDGLANSSGLVGRNLMLHPLGYVEGDFDEPLDTDIGPQGCMIYSLEHYRNKAATHKLGYLLHCLRGAGLVEAAESLRSKRKLRFGPDLIKCVKATYNHQAVISVICEDLPNPKNRLVLDLGQKDRYGIPGVRVHYELGENTKALMIDGLKNAKTVLKRAGARKTYAAGPVKNTGWHIMGTAKMGRDSNKSVVNTIGKTHDVDNLYIVDSSVFVTGSCVNPANTIQAVALFLSDRIAEAVDCDGF